MALPRNFGVNHAEGGQVGGIACAAYTSTPPRNAADFLELAENGVFWIGNLSVPLTKPWMGTREKPIVVPEQVSPKRSAGRQRPRSSFP